MPRPYVGGDRANDDAGDGGFEHFRGDGRHLAHAAVALESVGEPRCDRAVGFRVYVSEGQFLQFFAHALHAHTPGKRRINIRDFAREYGLTFELLHDDTGDIQQAYQTTGIPETYIIGPDGVIRRKHIGPADWNSEANRALVAQLLGVPVPPPPAAVGGDTAVR